MSNNTTIDNEDREQTLYLKRAIIIPEGTACRFFPQSTTGCRNATVDIPVEIGDTEAGYGGHFAVYVGEPGSKAREAAKVWFSRDPEPVSERDPALPPSIEDKVDITADKHLRVELDKQLQYLKDLSPSRERSLARTKLEEAVMWLGMDLKRLGTPNPYPNSRDVGNTIVDPTADGLKL